MRERKIQRLRDFSLLRRKASQVQKGYNSDLSVNGRSFHVQTEDWGSSKAAIVTKVFQNGAVLKSFVTPYSDFESEGPVNQIESVKLAMRRQHRQILDLVHSGQL